MPTWDIQPLGVRDVLDRTVDRANDIEGWGSGYSDHLNNAATYAGTLAMNGQAAPAMGIVGAALNEFAEATQTDVQYIVARASASLTGASDATMAYVDGDLEMAAEAQRQALRPPEMPRIYEGPSAGGYQEPQ
ncbi:DUF6507 family protein [Streptomyces sp. B6B3]|uniref:DUF6507 family protein n=1 Tax=Streptomyces sp. B6B3 TaxID=3153570 RepID=UPI00325F27D2